MNIGNRATYLNKEIPGIGVLPRTNLSDDSFVPASDEVNSLNGLASSANAPPLNPRERLQRVPLRNIAIFFGTLLLIGFMRSPELLAIWVFGWGSYFLFQLVFAVKKKVDERKPK
jgi:hypothetical protein